MRTIDRSTAFRRDYRRLLGGARHGGVDQILQDVVMALASDQPLPVKHRDHPLAGQWAGYRDCHLKFDLVLIYRKRGGDLLELVRIGTHSELFGK